MQQHIIICAFCKGTGQNPHFRAICSVCKGAGSNQITGKYMSCADCRGSGQKGGTTLTCYTCSGVGVVPETCADFKQAKHEINSIRVKMEKERAQFAGKQRKASSSNKH